MNPIGKFNFKDFLNFNFLLLNWNQIIKCTEHHRIMRPKETIVLSILFNLKLVKYETEHNRTSSSQRSLTFNLSYQQVAWWDSRKLRKSDKEDLEKFTRSRRRTMQNHQLWKWSECTSKPRICWMKSRCITSTEKFRLCKDSLQQILLSLSTPGLKNWVNQNSKLNYRIRKNIHKFYKSKASTKMLRKCTLHHLHQILFPLTHVNHTRKAFSLMMNSMISLTILKMMLKPHVSCLMLHQNILEVCLICHQSSLRKQKTTI